jgi:hypothetical protein
MEIESDSGIPFLDVLIIRKGTALATKVCRKPSHAGRYLNLKPNNPPYVKRGIFYIQYNSVRFDPLFIYVLSSTASGQLQSEHKYKQEQQ